MEKEAIATVHRLTEQVGTLNDTVENLRVCIEWMAHNTVGGNRPASPPEQFSPDIRQIVFDMAARIDRLEHAVDEMREAKKQKKFFD
jgi:hypothetical protein